jgi:polysaccharide export outer membrane protein
MRLKRLLIVGLFATAWGCLAFSAEPQNPAAAAPNAATAAPSMAAGPGAQVPAGPASTAAAPTAEVASAAVPGAAGAAAGSAITAAEPVVSKDYVLQPGDELQIAVWKETDLTLDVFIRPDGGISFPLAGDLPAAGRSVAELTTMLEKRVRRYEPDAVVTVMVKAAIGNRVYVIGKVNKPGDFALNRPIDVMQALSLAGGATPFANTNHIRVLRREGTGIRAIAFRYGDVQRGRKLDQNILLKSGDTVVVP